MRKLLLAAICFILWAPSVSSAKDIYIAQNSAGTNSGVDCANAYSTSFFNNSANWGTGATKISPGDTVHLCGTFTGTAGSTMLATRGSGSSGSPITILFETDAVLTAPYWSAAGAVQINHNYIILDGGTNGLITATANGTALANQVVSDGVHIGESGTPNNVEVRNLSVTNMCVRQANSSNTSCKGNGIRLMAGGGNIWIHHNTIHDVSTGIFYVITVTESGDRIYSNKIFNRNAGIIYAACASGITITNTLIYGNEIGDAVNWDDPGNSYHHDGIHFFNCGGTNGVVTGAQTYNNFFYGDLGIHSTAAFFTEDSATSHLVYNNLFTASNGSAPTNGFIYYKSGSGHRSFNNTFVGAGGGTAITMNTGTNNEVRNNIIFNVNYGINCAQSSNCASYSHNVYFNIGSGWLSPGTFSTFAAWQASGRDVTGSAYADPRLDISYHLMEGSPSIGTATNLSTIFTADRAGNPRQLAGFPWDSGCYVYLNLPPPNPPTNLSVK